MYESFDEYIKTMEKEKEHFPDHVYEFATDSKRQELQSPHPLHDSWLTSLTIKENRKIDRPCYGHLASVNSKDESTSLISTIFHIGS